MRETLLTSLAGRAARALFAAGLLLVTSGSACAQILLSGNENKLDLTGGAARAVPNPAPDSITLVDFVTFPPKTTTLSDIPNTVIGPPSNIAITPDRSLALIANSVNIDPANPTNTIPNNEIHLLDLSGNPPRILGRVTAGRQPSGISITPNGRLALVANRAGGSVSVLRIRGKEVVHLGEVKVGEPTASASDVAISPDGRLALVSLQKAGVLIELELNGESVEPTGRRFSVYGQPYRVVITPDGRFALTSGAGFGNGTDHDAVSVVDLKALPPRAVQHLTTGISPESIEISPDGKLLAVVTMEGSNLAVGNPSRSTAGGLYLYRRNHDGFELSQTLKTGRIPEGVAFTSDGRYLVIQCHPDRELRLYRVSGGKVRDTGERVKLPGMPSSLRAAK
jgi:DNA-binding beta-propeller fold protein YncE